MATGILNVQHAHSGEISITVRFPNCFFPLFSFLIDLLLLGLQHKFACTVSLNHNTLSNNGKTEQTPGLHTGVC